MNKPLTIGKLASASGVGVETIRFYENKELIKKPAKNGGFRHYPYDYVTRIQFIKRAQELGFTLAEVKELLNLRVQKLSKCSDVLNKTESKIIEIDEKIKDLKRMKKSLQTLANCCEDKNASLSECPILEHF